MYKNNQKIADISFQNAVTSNQIDGLTTIQQILVDIKEGKYIDQIQKLRNISRTDPMHRELKKKLPAFIPTGTYHTRLDDKLIEPSGFAIADIDKISNNLIRYNEILRSDPYVYSVFLSPSGDGLKVIYKIPKVKGKDEYVRRAKAFTKHLVKIGIPIRDAKGIGIDPGGSEKLSLACFVSYDPLLFLNSDSLIWEKIIPESGTQKPVLVRKAVSPTQSINEILAPFLTNKMNHHDIWLAVSEIIEANIPENETQEFFKKYNTLLFREDGTDFEDYSKVEKDISLIYAKYRKQAEQLDDEGYLLAYIRVSTHYFRRAIRQDGNGFVLLPHTRQAIIDDHGRDAIKRVIKYLGFTIVPDNFNRVREKNGYYNLYENIVHKPTPGDWTNTGRMVEHIFGQDQIEYGLDFIQLLVFNPIQRTPNLCLVSIGSNTGKTTFATWIRKVLSPNAIEIKAKILKRDFNSEYIDKRLIIVDEVGFSSLEMQDLKSLATSDTQHFHAKGKDAYPIPFYGSFIFCSNDEISFITLSQTEDRFWIRTVPEINETQKDPLFADKIEKEIPAFLDFLKNREMNVKTKQGRFWINTDDLQTEVQIEIKEASKHGWVQNLEDKIEDYFMQKDAEEEVKLILSDIMELFIAHQRNPPKRSTVSNYLKHEERIKPFPKDSSPGHYSRRWLEKVFPTETITPSDKTGRYYTLKKNDWVRM
ncbi:BT4734/BF3469 family protein [Bacteroidota bacterium]